MQVRKSLQKHCCKREGGYLSLSIMSKLCHHYGDVGGFISINMDLSLVMQLVEVLSKTLSSNLGKGGATNSDEFLEKFQTAFDPPPPHFWKIILQFFIMDMVAFMQGCIG